jgi:hypothetical protein
VSSSRVRRIMAEGIDAPKLPKGAIVEMVKQAQKIRVNDGPTAFSRRRRKATK